jgi:hypothetical protein
MNEWKIWIRRIIIVNNRDVEKNKVINNGYDIKVYIVIIT